MNQLHKVAQYIVASLRLAMTEQDEDTFPTSHGLLDKALEEALKAGNAPEWVRKELHFVDGRTGRRCIELRDILGWAQMLSLTSAPNPSYRYTQFRFGPEAAGRILENLGMNREEARAFGERLQKGLAGAEEAAGDEESLEVLA